MNASRITALVLRRMRPPLLVLLAAYFISILGLTLVPGVDDQGRPWRMDFFEAYYFVSYMATTIGFGEIPYAFSDAQRMWVIVSIYLTVVAWVYAIGSILGLIQDPAFRGAVTHAYFARTVRHLRERFYLVCGFGDTGKALVRALTDRYITAVVIDPDQESINDLTLQDYPVYVPGLCANATLPPELMRAGLTHRYCAGVVALTHKDDANLKIAIASKLLNPKLPVICRVESHDYEVNIASFGTEHVINPFDVFAEHLAMAIRSPGHFLLYDWLTEVPHSFQPKPLTPPHGRWILCGFGRFGKTVHARLLAQGIEVQVIEADPGLTQAPKDTVMGRGTEADTLIKGGVKNSVAIVAGTDIDANNLSIVMTALELNPDLFVAIRQNRAANRSLFKAVNAHLVMHASEIMAREVRVMLTLPLLTEFLKQALEQDKDWANLLASRISGLVGGQVPDVWSVTLRRGDAEAALRAIDCGVCELSLRHLQMDPLNRDARLPCVPLMLARDGELTLTPDEMTELKPGDEILFCGAYGIGARMEWALQNVSVLEYLVSGQEGPDGSLWRWLRGRRAG